MYTYYQMLHRSHLIFNVICKECNEVLCSTHFVHKKDAAWADTLSTTSFNTEKLYVLTTRACVQGKE